MNEQQEQIEVSAESALRIIRESSGELVSIRDSAAETITRLQAELAEARKDTARLDWLEVGPCFHLSMPAPGFKTIGTVTVDCGSFSGHASTLRAAIDAARRAEATR